MNCIICDKKTYTSMSPDLDVQGLAFCKEHKEDVQAAYVILVTAGEKLYKRFVKSMRKKLLV